VRANSTLEIADRYLKTELIPLWDGRFTIPPTDQVDARLPLPQEVDLARLFAETEARNICSDFLIRYRNERLHDLRSDRGRRRSKDL